VVEFFYDCLDSIILGRHLKWVACVRQELMIPVAIDRLEKSTIESQSFLHSVIMN
jgi:hypothetical protein